MAKGKGKSIDGGHGGGDGYRLQGGAIVESSTTNRCDGGGDGYRLQGGAIVESTLTN